MKTTFNKMLYGLAIVVSVVGFYGSKLDISSDMEYPVPSTDMPINVEMPSVDEEEPIIIQAPRLPPPAQEIGPQRRDVIDSSVAIGAADANSHR